MSVIPLSRSHPGPARTVVDVDIVVPVYNERDQMAASITALRAYLDDTFPFSSTITIADNASTDDTWLVACGLVASLPGVSAIHLDRKGRGRALRSAWSRSHAEVVAYMDVDLATGLDALLPLIAPLLSGHSDLAIGTRLGPGAHVVRGARRELLSRGYNLLVRTALRSECTDAQCGFKAMRRQAALEVLPLVEDDEWFFDTELLVTAQRLGLRIHEVPVDWVDDVDSRVDVLPTALKDLRGIYRLLGPASRRRVVLSPDRPSPDSLAPPTAHRAGPPRPEVGQLLDIGRRRRGDAPGPGPIVHLPDLSLAPASGADGARTPVFADELLRFAGVGVVSTAAYVGLFAALEPSLGSYLANAVAIGLCSVGNTAAHRGMAGTDRFGLDRTQRILTATALLGVSLSFTTGAIAATRAVGWNSLVPELGAVSAANVAAAVIRFGILRTWVFRPEFGTQLADHAGASEGGTQTNPSMEMTRTP